MSTTLKIFLFLFASSVISAAVFAASPFEILSKYLPDIAVTDIHQETKFIYVRVCNFGGVISDTENNLVIVIKKTNGGIISVVEPAILDTNNCHEFQLASIDELGIITSGIYTLAAGAVIKNGRDETNQTNNTLSKAINISFPSINLSVIQQQFIQPTTYYSNTNTTNCNASNNYCANTSYNYNYNNNFSCNASNNYCSITNSNYYPNTGVNNIQNTCPIGDIVCNNNYYNSVNNGQYQNTYNTSCIFANNYCNYTYNSNYYNNNYNNTQYCTAANNYCANNNYYVAPITYYRSNICPVGDVVCNNNYYNSTNSQYQNTGDTTCTYLNNYCNYTYNPNYLYNTSTNLPDLIVQSLYQNSGDKNIIAQICNRGGNMTNSTSIRTSFFANNRTTNIYNILQMGQGQCTSTIVY